MPTIKTLLKYAKMGNKKSVLCDYLIKSDDKFSQVELEHDILSRNPFESKWDYMEINQKTDTCFHINSYRDDKFENFIIVNMVHVLEFKGKIFELKEGAYDIKEYECEED